MLRSSDLPGWVVKKTETTPAAASGVVGGYGLLYQTPGVLHSLCQGGL